MQQGIPGRGCKEFQAGWVLQGVPKMLHHDGKDSKIRVSMKSKECMYCGKHFCWKESRGKFFCSHSCYTKYRNLIYGNPMQNKKAKEKSSLSHMGKHYSTKTEIKKGQHLSVMTELKNGDHKSPRTEFKKEQIPWNKGKPYLKIRGENHWKWMGGKSRNRYRGYGWENIRKMIWQRDGFECQICGKNNCRLHTHHIIPYSISKDNSLDNLVTLCTSCHTRIELGGDIFEVKSARLEPNKVLICSGEPIPNKDTAEQWAGEAHKGKQENTDGSCPA